MILLQHFEDLVLVCPPGLRLPPVVPAVLAACAAELPVSTSVLYFFTTFQAFQPLYGVFLVIHTQSFEHPNLVWICLNGKQIKDTLSRSIFFLYAPSVRKDFLRLSLKDA